jgi:hypothetical protein
LWISFWIILGVNIGIGDARGRAGMIGAVRHEPSRSSTALSFSTAMQPPVGRRTYRLQATLALSAVLVAQNPQLSLPVPPQSVWAKQPMPMPMLVDSGYRRSVLYRPPDQTIDVFLWLSAKRYAHAPRIPVDQNQLL